MSTDPEPPLDRDQIQVRLTARFPHLPAGVILAAVGRSRPPQRRDDQPVLTWRDVEAAAEERLLLRAAMRDPQLPATRQTSPGARLHGAPGTGSAPPCAGTGTPGPGASAQRASPRDGRASP